MTIEPTFDVAFRIEGRFRLEAANAAEALDIVEHMDPQFIILPGTRVDVTDVYKVQPDGSEPPRCLLCKGVIDPKRVATAHARGMEAKYDKDDCRIIAAKRRWRKAHPGAGATAKPKKRARKAVR